MTDFMPHGYCLQWNTPLLILFVAGNFLIAVSYFSIPLTLSVLINNRKDLSFKWVYALFAAFIVACGLTHLMKVWTIWHATYWLEASLDLLTGIISLVTAVLLWLVLPRALALNSAGLLMFQSLFNAMPQLGWTAKPNGDIDFYNKRWYEYTGTTFESMQGWGWQAVHDQSILPKVIERWRYSLETQTAFEMEFPLKSKSQEFRWFLTRIIPYKNAQGNLVRWIGINTDIDDIKQAEVQVLQRQMQLETMSEVIPQMVWTADADGLVDYFNSRWSEYTGLTFEQTKGWEWKQVIHPDDRQNCLERWAETLKLGTGYEIEYRLKRADGMYRWFLGRAMSVKDQHGHVVKWVGSCTDIHEQKERSESLEQLVKARTIELETLNIKLNRSEQRLSIALEAAEMGVWDTDLVTGQVWRSLKYDQIFGYKTLQPNWTYESMLSHVLPDDVTLVKEVHERALVNGSLNLECRIVHNDSIRWIAASGKTYFDENGQPLRLTGAVTDINERKEAEKKLNQLANELAQSNKELEHFAYLASHDLQEPLRTVISFCNLLAKKSRDTLDPDSVKYLDVILENSARMQQLIRDLLLYARVQSQGNPLAPVDLGICLNQAIKALNTAIVEANASVTHDEMPKITGDETQLSLLFQNLIANAIKFHSDKPPEIHIGACKEGEYWKISCTDNGIGMKMEYAERIFIIFQRLHSRSKFDGTGIGLAVCKRIVERHQGSITVNSSPGKGSTFTITLKG